MGYSMIFQEKVVRLEDGSVVYFVRHGCNNDTNGRKKDIYDVMKFQSASDFLAFAWCGDGDPLTYSETGSFDLMVNYKPFTFYDYFKHLNRLYKKADTVESFGEKYVFHWVEMNVELVDNSFYRRTIAFESWNLSDCIDRIENPGKLVYIKKRA